MNLKIKTLSVVLLALLASACGNEDMVPAGSDHLTDAPVSITVGGVGTRLGYDRGHIIDEGSLGFWLDQSGTQYDAENLEVKYESGVWIPQGRLLWKNATDDVEYAASYPYDADGVYEVSLPADQFNSEMLPFDILYAEGRVRGEDGAVNIVFSHALAQLKVKLTFGETLGTNPQIMSITLSNAALDGTFTVRDANGCCAWSNQGNSGEVTLLKNYSAEFECLLIPQTIEDYYITVDAVVGGIEKQYRFESSDLVLEQGATYTLPLQVGTDHPYVDLGLPSGTLWAKCNVGANAPEEVGDYFAWGETAPKTSYNFKNEGDYKYGIYNYSDTDNYGTTKYNNIDGMITLEATDDAATVILGSEWRTPTVDDFNELLTKCTWTATSRNDVSGFEVKGQNGNSIFIPVSGFRRIDDLNAPTSGYYWTSSLVQSDVRSASILELNIMSGASVSVSMCYFGLPVRAVRTR